MNVLQFFRKPYMAALMAGLILFASCNRGEGIVTEDVVSAVDFENLHEQIRFELSSMDKASLLKSINSDIEGEFHTNLEFTNENGLESLFEAKGIDVKFIDILKFYKTVENEPNVYELLLENFDIGTYEEAVFILNFAEIYNLVELDLGIDPDSSLKGVSRISWECVGAIAGSILVTAGATAISGGAALIVFLASKGLSTAMIVAACR